MSGASSSPIDGGAEIASLQTRSAPFEASLEFAGRGWLLVDELEIRNEDSEAAHAFEIVDEIDGFRTRQRLRFPDGTVCADEGMAHEGGVAYFTGTGLIPGRELLFIARSDIVFADGEFELDLGDGEPIRQPDFEEDRRYRWRNRVLWVPADRIDGDTIRFGMRRVDSDRALSHFHYWLYQPTEAPKALEPELEPAQEPMPVDEPDAASVDAVSTGDETPSYEPLIDADPPTETIDIPSIALMDPPTAIDADAGFLAPVVIGAPLADASADETRRATPPVMAAAPLPPRRPAMPATQVRERVAPRPQPAVVTPADPQPKSPVTGEGLIAVPSPVAPGDDAQPSADPAPSDPPADLPDAAAADAGDATRLPTPPARPGSSRPMPAATVITPVSRIGAPAPVSEARERLVTIALTVGEAADGAVTEHLAEALAKGWTIARFEPVAHPAGAWIVVHLRRG